MAKTLISGNHQIASQRFDVHMDESLRPQDVQDAFSKAQANRLEKTIDAVLTEFDQPGKVIRLGSLALDIGPIDYNILERDLVEKVELHLRRALRQAIDHPEEEQEVEVEEDEVARAARLLEYFLLHGIFPWYTSDSETTPERLFDLLRFQDMDRLLRMIRDIGRKSDVRTRLILQLDNQQLEALVHGLEPVHAQFIIDYSQELQRKHEQEPVVRDDAQSFRDARWELILRYLLVDRGSLFNRMAFLESTTRGLASHYRLDYLEFLSFMTYSVEVENVPESAKTSLPFLIRQLLDKERGRLAIQFPVHEPGSLSYTEVDQIEASRNDAFDEEMILYFLEHLSFPFGIKKPWSISEFEQKLLTWMKQLSPLERGVLRKHFLQSDRTRSPARWLSDATNQAVLEAVLPGIAAQLGQDVQAVTKLLEAASIGFSGQSLQTEQWAVLFTSISKAGGGATREVVLMSLIAEWALVLGYSTSVSASGSRALVTDLTVSSASSSAKLPDISRIPQAFQAVFEALLLQETSTTSSGLQQELEKFLELLSQVAQHVDRKGVSTIKGFSAQSSSVQKTLQPLAGKAMETWQKVVWQEVIGRWIDQWAQKLGIAREVLVAFFLLTLGSSSSTSSTSSTPSSSSTSSVASTGSQAFALSAFMEQVQNLLRQGANTSVSGTTEPRSANATTATGAPDSKDDQIDSGTQSSSNSSNTPITPSGHGAKASGEDESYSDSSQSSKDRDTRKRQTSGSLPTTEKAWLEEFERVKRDQSAQDQQKFFQRQINLILYFFSHGTLPWWSSVRGPQGFETLVRALIKEDVKRFRSVFLGWLQSRSSIQSFIRHVTEDLLILLLDVIRDVKVTAKGSSVTQRYVRWMMALTEVIERSYVGTASIPNRRSLAMHWRVFALTRVIETQDIPSGKGLRLLLEQWPKEAGLSDVLFRDMLVWYVLEQPEAGFTRELLPLVAAWIETAKGKSTARLSAEEVLDILRSQRGFQHRVLSEDLRTALREITARKGMRDIEKILAIARQTSWVEAVLEHHSQTPRGQRWLSESELFLFVLEAARKQPDVVRRMMQRPTLRQLFVTSYESTELFQLVEVTLSESAGISRDEFSTIHRDMMSLGRHVMSSLEFDRFESTLFHALLHAPWQRNGSATREEILLFYLQLIQNIARLSTLELLEKTSDFASVSATTRQLIQQSPLLNSIRKREETAVKAKEREASLMDHLGPEDEDETEETIEDPDETVEEEIERNRVFVRNAGLVLLWPYFSMLFERSGIMEEGKFKDEKAAYYGVHLLNYLVWEEEDPPESSLLLNKILCKVKRTKPIVRRVEIAAEHKELCTSLIQAAIDNWGRLGSTSVEGFRVSFLQRDGGLKLEDGRYEIRVEQKPYDMLIDTLPWSISIIKTSWMELSIVVQWR